MREEDVYAAVVSVGLGETGDDMDMFVPVGGDEDGMLEGIACRGDASF